MLIQRHQYALDGVISQSHTIRSGLTVIRCHPTPNLSGLTMPRTAGTQLAVFYKLPACAARHPSRSAALPRTVL
jgi:hypothetical protein